MAAALVVSYPRDAYLFTEDVLLRYRLWWLNRRMKSMARKIYRQLQRDHEALGLPPLPPFSWKALEQRYGDVQLAVDQTEINAYAQCQAQSCKLSRLDYELKTLGATPCTGKGDPHGVSQEMPMPQRACALEHADAPRE